MKAVKTNRNFKSRENKTIKSFQREERFLNVI